MKKINILITNDDGYAANGINALTSVIREIANVVVVSPAEPQSGKSAAISLMNQLTLHKIDELPATEDLGSLIRYSFTGTPVDCAKMGIHLFQEKGLMPDYLVSGINHGTNASAAAIYSGTLGATKEGAIYQVPSIAFSYSEFDPKADLTTAVHFVRLIMKKVFEIGIKQGTYWNVNIPAIPVEEVKGIQITIQGRGRWIREFDHLTKDGDDDLFVMLGDFIDLSGRSRDDDHIANDNGYVSITPQKVDTTDYMEFERIKAIWDK